MRKLRVLVLMHEDLVPPEDPDECTEKEQAEWKTEFDVVTGLRESGHDVRPLGVFSDLGVIRTAIEEFKPHVAFNLLEEFHGVALFDQHVVSYLELMRQAYTGCNPRGLTLAHDKGLSKKLMLYHRVRTPRFAVFPIGQRIKLPKRLPYPLVVKSATEHASLGISQASVVSNDDKLVERITFVHDNLGTDAIAESYIEGRELYVSILGNRRLTLLPTWEIFFTNLPEGAPRIATRKVKWDEEYQKKIGLKLGPAMDLDSHSAEQLEKTCRRAFRALGLSGYARLDFRLSAEGHLYLLEVNPNPDIAYGEELAEAAHHAGLDYNALLQRILNLGMSYRPHWRHSGG